MAYNSYPKLSSATKKSSESKSVSASPPGKPKPNKQASMLNLLKVDPKDSPEQKKIKEKHNEMAATVYSNNRSGSQGIKNHVPYASAPGTKTDPGYSKFTIDPESSRRADSVRTLMVKKYQKNK